MIEFDVPSFFSIRTPGYSFDGGSRMPALRLFPPFIKSELHALVGECRLSGKFADSFNRFVMITFAAMLCAGFGATMSLFSHLYFHYRGFFYPTFLMLAVCFISNFMAWYNFKRMAESYIAFFSSNRDCGISFQHFEISDNGIFRRGIDAKKTDLI